MINIDSLNDDEKLAALESIHKSIAESKEIQKKKITTNVEMILKALKKIEGDLKQRYDETGKLIANLKNGTDGRDGKEGRDGKDGRAGKDGAMGPRGYDGLPGRNGLDGEDGVSVTDAHIDFDGSLIISLSSGRVINVGEVVTADIAERIKVITNGGGTSQYVLDTLASLQSQISAISSGLEYQGTWNASTNVPTLTSSVGTAGYYYIVATAGSTNLNGITDWQVGDWAVFNGTVWQKIDQSNLVTSVAGRTGAIVLTTADIGGLGTIATQASSNVSITGGSITGITDLAIADGGTGQSTAAAAITALTGTQTSGYYLRSNGTNSVLAAIVAADVPTLNQNTTGSAGSLSNTLPVSQGGTNLTSLTNKGVLYASSTSQVATGTALQFDGTNLGVGTTQSTWGATFKAIEIGEQGSIAYESNGSTKKTYLSTNAYNATAIGARPYYKVNGLASEYTQNVGEHAWYTAPTGIAGSSTTITSGEIYTNLTAGNQPDFGAVNGLVGTIWTATSSGTLTSGTVVQNISFIESMRIDASSNVGIGISNPGSRLDVKGTLRLSGSTSGYVGLAPAAAAGSTTYTLPSADGTSGQSLTTNGSGTLSWASGSSATVTSVAASGGTTGLTFSGSPITTSGTLTLGGTLAIANGGTGTAIPALVAGTNVTITGSWPNQTINSSNTGGTVTSVSGTGTVNGLTLTGTVTTSGSLTLGGTLSGIANSALTNSSITIGGTAIALGASSNTLANDITINGLTVGRGAGAVSTNTAVGTNALAANTTGYQNASFGYVALQANTTGYNNAAFGEEALYLNTTGALNTGIGQEALRSNTTGSSNTAVGEAALRSNTTASNNTAVGYQSLYLSTGADNTAVGFSAGRNTTTGQVHAFGRYALYTNTTGTGGSAFGNTALFSNTTGNNNSAFGEGALNANTTASNNTAVGYQAGYSQTTSNNITALGYQALYVNTAPNNTAVGSFALTANTSGNGNAALGRSALGSNTTGAGNSAFGSYDGSIATLNSNTTGSYNSAFGLGALASNTTASNNTAVGFQAGYTNTTGVNNIAFGAGALLSNATGGGLTAIGTDSLRSTTVSNNTAVGVGAMYSNTTGAGNTAVGNGLSGTDYGTLALNTTGSANTAMGQQALRSNTTASNNTAVGYQAGYSNETGAQSTFVGTQAGYTGTDIDFAVAVGYRALYANTADSNTAVGYSAAVSNTSGTANVALGRDALYSNTTASNNTAVGYQAGYSNTGTVNTFIGTQAGYSNSVGNASTGVGYKALYASNGAVYNDAFGSSALVGNTTGLANNAFGQLALQANTTGSFNTAMGLQALQANTTASNNTAVGYQAGYTNTTGTRLTALGYLSGYTSNADRGTFIGAYSGQNTTGVNNTFVGDASGYLVTSGTKNTIIGLYSGNASGLDIRTASNYIVLSDGDGNPRQVIDNNGRPLFGAVSAFGSGFSTFQYLGATYNGISVVQTDNPSGSRFMLFSANGADCGVIDRVGTTSAVVYTATSDYRLKNVTGAVSGQGARIDALKPIDYQWKEDNSQARGFLAHEFQTVYPNSVTGTKDALDADGNPKYQAMQASSSEVIADLVAEIQSLRKRLADAGI